MHVKKKAGERVIELLLGFSALLTVLTTVAVVVVLFTESFNFFRKVSLIEFFTNTQWTPLFTQKNFGILPLVSATFLTSLIAIAVALPVGLTIAIYLSEYAPRSFRKVIK